MKKGQGGESESEAGTEKKEGWNKRRDTREGLVK